MALGERAQEARFQPVAAGMRRVERKRGVHVQGTRGVVFDPRIQGIEQAVRLAQCQRRADAQVAVHAREQPIDGGVEAGEVVGHSISGVNRRRRETSAPATMNRSSPR